MKTLFIDTHSELLTIGIINGSEILTKEVESYNSHSIILLPLIDTLLKENNLKINDIDRIVVLNGPGSFTGIRIGLTVAKTIGYALNKDVYPISSLKAYLVSSNLTGDKMAYIEDSHGYYVCALDKDNNVILDEQYVEEIDGYNYEVVDNKLNISKIVEYATSFEPVKINSLKANYVKKIGVEQ